MLALCAFPSIFFRSVSWIVSWLDRPVVVSSAARDQLARLHVTVAIPAYNEDPGLLDRCLYALVNQTRPPQLVCVVDDGSATDYTALKRYWAGHWSAGTEIRWMRQHNQGKRRAHAVVFDSVPDTDIFITVDSDTTLELHAIEEGLKPFRSRGVMSVAGIEMGTSARPGQLRDLVDAHLLAHPGWCQKNLGPADESLAGQPRKGRQPIRRSGRTQAPDPPPAAPQNRASRAGSTIPILPAEYGRLSTRPFVWAAARRSS